MNKIKFYKVLAIAGVILWVSETAYFGWNKTAQSSMENMLDVISHIMIFWGIVGDITQNLTIQKINKTEITTEKTIINRT